MDTGKGENTENTRQWLPIFAGPEKENIWGVVKDIADILHEPPAAWIPLIRVGVEPYRVARGASLALGSAGLALFYAYLSRVSGASSVFADEADRFLSEACDVLELAPLPVGLYRGIGGIAWVVQHLQGFLYNDESYNPETDPNNAIDRILFDSPMIQEKFDLWEGCVGLGVYGLERLHHPTAEKNLELLLRRLDSLSSQCEGGVTWFTPPGAQGRGEGNVYSRGYYDLGVAHGIAGVISFLSRVHARHILPDLTGRLLEGAVSWLLARQWDHDDGSMFPQFLLPPDNKPLTTSTYGFCHGDLGVAAALVSAAACMGNSSWKGKAMEAAHSSVRYLEKAEMLSNFSNPHLCHGAAGLGHLFNRIYQATAEETFRDEACKWFRRTLELRRPGTGIAGFSKNGLNEDGEMSELYDPGFIQGAAGIGLALLSAITDMEPKWDRVMLISS